MCANGGESEQKSFAATIQRRSAHISPIAGWKINKSMRLEREHQLSQLWMTIMGDVDRINIEYFFGMPRASGSQQIDK